MVCGLERFDVLVHVLDHHDGAIDHRTDGDRDAAERHDVGVDPLPVHDDERREHTDGQRHHRHERRAQMEQENGADQRHHDELLDQLVAQVVHGAVNQQRPVIGGHDLHARWQARLERLDLGFDRLDRCTSVLARAHDDDATRHFAFAVQLGNAATHFRADLNCRDIPQQDGCALGHGQGNRAEIVQRAQVAARTHHVLGLGKFNDRATRGLIGRLEGTQDHRLRDAQGAHAIGV